MRINLPLEAVIPGFCSLSWYTQSRRPIPEIASLLAETKFGQAEQELSELQSGGLKMTTRSVYRASRTVKEISFIKTNKTLPLAHICALGPLLSSISGGL
jgi:hypothetical protein